MARKRSISTEISIDKQVNKMAGKYGDFTALFYTWLIPHVEDDCEITGDPEELLFIVCPMRRDKTPEDIEAVINAMVEFKLVDIFIRDDKPILIINPKSFYKYQTYISKSNRDYRTKGQRETPKNAENHKETPRITEEHKETQENTVSPPPSLTPPPSLSLSLSLTPPPPPSNNGGAGKEKNIGDIKKVYEDTFGLINGTIVDDINYFLDTEMEPDVIIAAIKESARNTKRWKYAMGILNNCLIDGIKTLSQFEARGVEFENHKKNSKGYSSPPKRVQKADIDRESEDYKLMLQQNDYREMLD